MEPLRRLCSGLAAVSAAIVTAVLAAQPALAAPSVLTPSPNPVQAGEPVTITGTGFTLCTDVQSLEVLWDKNPLQPISVTPGNSGFKAEVIAPPNRLGSNQVVAQCSQDGVSEQQDASVDVVTLASSPQAVQGGNPVTISGSGFTLCTDSTGSTTVQLSAGGTPLATATGSNGNFRQVVTVPAGAPAGPYPVTAQCSDTSAGDPTSASVYVVTLELSPTLAVPGETVTVTGAGYTPCKWVQLQLRDGKQPLATASPVVPAGGGFTADLTVPSGAIPGRDYWVDAGCCPATTGSFTVVAGTQLTVTSPPSSGSPSPSPTLTSSPSPTSASSGPPSSGPPSSGPPSSGSPSPTSALRSQSPRGTASPHQPQGTGGLWSPVALIGGTTGALALAAVLLLARAVPMVHGRRNRGWVRKHLRMVAGPAGPASAEVQRRPGAPPASLGLEPHLDDRGNQQYEEMAR